jgi:hypothetical protein
MTATTMTDVLSIYYAHWGKDEIRARRRLHAAQLLETKLGENLPWMDYGTVEEIAECLDSNITSEEDALIFLKDWISRLLDEPDISLRTMIQPLDCSLISRIMRFGGRLRSRLMVRDYDRLMKSGITHEQVLERLPHYPSPNPTFHDIDTLRQVDAILAHY